MRIAICDDVDVAAIILKNIISDIAFEWNKDWIIDVFDSGEKLLEKIRLYDVVFLDVEMPGMNGIEVGEKIQELNPDCRIVMQTGELKYANDAFKIKAMRYLTKPIKQYDVREALNSIEEQNVGAKSIEAFCNRIQYDIAQKDIMFVKSINGYCEIYTDTMVLRKDVSMDKMESLLDSRLFFRIHRENIINLDMIKQYKDGVIDIGNQTFAVARRKKKDFEKVYREYDLKYGWKK